MSILALCLSGACGRVDDGYTVQGDARSAAIHSALVPYFQDFVRLNPLPTPAIRMTIAPLERGVAGKCFHRRAKPVEDQVGDSVFGETANHEARVVVDSGYYNLHRHDYLAIQQVVLHELGHCLLERRHEPGWVVRQGTRIPRSLMYPSSFGTQPEYGANLPYYGRELFDPAYRDEWTTFVLSDRTEPKDGENPPASAPISTSLPLPAPGGYRCATDLE